MPIHGPKDPPPGPPLVRRNAMRDTRGRPRTRGEADPQKQSGDLGRQGSDMRDDSRHSIPFAGPNGPNSRSATSLAQGIGSHPVTGANSSLRTGVSFGATHSAHKERALEPTPSATSKPADKTSEVKEVPLLPALQVTARLLTLVTPNGPNHYSAELSDVRDQTEMLFLNGDVGYDDVLVLVAQANHAFNAIGQAHLAEECRSLFELGYRNPAPTLQRAIEVIEKAQTFASEDTAALMHQTADILKDILEESDEQSSTPVANMALAANTLNKMVHKIQVSDTTHQVIKALNIVIDDQSITMTEKFKRMTRISQSAEGYSPVAPEVRSLMRNIQAQFSDVITLQAMGRSVPATAKQPQLPSIIDQNEENIATALYNGITAASIATRALALQQLISLPSRLSVLLQQSIISGIDTADIAPDSFDAARIDRFVASLLPTDIVAIKRSIENNELIQNAISSRPLFLAYARPPAPVTIEEELILEDLMVEAAGTANTFKKMINSDAARQIVQVRAALTRLDHMDDAMHQLQAIQTQLTPPAAALNDNISGRAFESVLSTRILQLMPASAKSTWAKMAEAMAAVLEDHEELKEDKQWERCNRVLRHAFISRGTRPWDNQSPLMQGLSRLAANRFADMIGAVADALMAPTVTGHDVLAKANLVRDVWIALYQSGVKAPLAAQTNGFYSVISPKTGRIIPDTAKMDQQRAEAPEFKKVQSPGTRAATGIMARHQPVPSGNLNALSSRLPGLINQVDVRNASVAKFIEKGAVTASGVSGSVNILVHFAEYARNTFRMELPARDVFLGAAEFVVHDGGHSFHEALWVQDHFMDSKHSLEQPLAAKQSYAELKQAFSDVPEVQQAFALAISDLVDYSRNLKTDGKT